MQVDEWSAAGEGTPCIIVCVVMQTLHASVSFPSLLVHATKPYLVCSPDGVVQTLDSCPTLVEVKTGKTKPSLASYNDQVQHNLLVSGHSQCIVLFYPTGDLRDHKVHADRIQASVVRASYEWQVAYQTTAQVLYDTYLKWLHESPVDLESGEVVLNALFAKELPVEPYRGQSGVQDDNERDDASDDSQIPQPVRISREFWGPRGTGRRSYCQRLFIVVFEDGTQESLVAEDLLDGCAEPFEENVFYANVLKDWRQEHAKAVRPVVAPR
jgi:hypothetical protein